MFQIGKRPEPATEIVQRKAAADTVQHINETFRMIQVSDHRRFRHLEADLRRRDAGVIQTVDNKF